MGLQLPGELISLLSMLGYNWPQADETKLFEMGNAWMGFPDRITAGLKNGVLSLFLPKAERAKTRRIEIKS